MSDPMFDGTPLAAPYDGTTGFSGSEASRDAAREDVESGKAADRQRRVLEQLRLAGRVGVTIGEFRENHALSGEHHGKVSSTFSSLHKAGEVNRLREKRNGSSVYVLPEFVGNRDTAQQGRQSGRVHGGGDNRKVVEVEVVREVPREIGQEDAEFVRVVRSAVAPQPVDGQFPIKVSTASRLLDIIDGLVRQG